MKKIVTRILLAILALAAIITGCIRLESITGPSSAALNSTFELTVNGSIKPETGYGPEGIALAILAPVEWNIRETAELSITTDGLGVFGVADVVDEPMSPIPADVALPKTGGNAGLVRRQQDR